MLAKKGFTLVELMVVIVIIGILAALAIPRFMQATSKAKASEIKPILKQVYTLQESYMQEANAYGLPDEIGFATPNSKYWDPVTWAAAPAIPAVGAIGSLYRATPVANALQNSTGTYMVAGTDDACVNTEGEVLAQSAALTSIAGATMPTSTAIATCSP